LSAFWVIGIGVNLVALVAVVVWAIVSWRRANAAQRERRDH